MSFFDDDGILSFIALRTGGGVFDFVNSFFPDTGLSFLKFDCPAELPELLSLPAVRVLAFDRLGDGMLGVAARLLKAVPLGNDVLFMTLSPFDIAEDCGEFL